MTPIRCSDTELLTGQKPLLGFILEVKGAVETIQEQADAEWEKDYFESLKEHPDDKVYWSGDTIIIDHGPHLPIPKFI